MWWRSLFFTPDLWFLLALTLLVSWPATIFCRCDTNPPSGDEARHLLACLRLLGGAWLNPDPGATYPPLGYWLLTLGMAGEPIRAHVAGAQGLLCMALFSALWAGGYALGGRWGGRLAALGAATSPLLAALLCRCYVDLAFTVFIALTYCCLLRASFGDVVGQHVSPPQSYQNEHKAEYWLVAAGVATAGAALCKYGFTLFLAAPVALGLWFSGPPRALGRRVVAWVAPVLLLAGPWYGYSWRVFARMGAFLGGGLYVPSEAAQGSLAAWHWLLWSLGEWLWGWGLALAVGGAVVFLAWRRVASLWAWLVMLALPLVILVFLPHRAPHYCLPQLVPSCLVIALAVGHAPVSRRLARLLVKGGGLGLLLCTLCLSWTPWLRRALGSYGESEHVLPAAYSTVSAGGSLARSWESMLGVHIDESPRPLAVVVSDALLHYSYDSDESPLFILRGQGVAQSMALAPGVPLVVDSEAVRYEVARQGGHLRVGTLGLDATLDDVALVLAPRGWALEKEEWSVVGEYCFPEGMMVLYVRR